MLRQLLIVTLVSIVSCSQLYTEKYFSSNDKVVFLFNIFDNYPKNEYLGYHELKFFQKLTDPQIVLTYPLYKEIMYLLCGNIHYGIDIKQFNSSYYLHKDDMGTDLNKDFNIIYKLLYENRM